MSVLSTLSSEENGLESCCFGVMSAQTEDSPKNYHDEVIRMWFKTLFTINKILTMRVVERNAIYSKCQNIALWENCMYLTNTVNCVGNHKFSPLQGCELNL